MTQPPQSSSPAPAAGRVVQGRYRIIAPIGEGGMGIVYRAEHVGLGRMVAVKFLHATMARDPQFVRRFDVEAQAMSRLSHPNCVAVLDFGLDGAPYLVMELVEGESLRSALAAGRMDPPRAIAIARQILSGLTHAHSQSVIHRDIKPENVLLDRRSGSDHVRLVDFGLAKLRNNQGFSTVGLALGTPQYMAPEQMREGAIDERVDIYLAGLVLYEMLTGVPAFDAVSLGAILMKQQHDPPPPFTQAAPDATIRPELEAVVRRALEKAPAARFGSAAEMAAALDEAAAAPSRFQHATTVRAAIGDGVGWPEEPPAVGRRSWRTDARLLFDLGRNGIVAAARNLRARAATAVGPDAAPAIARAREQARGRAAELVALARKHPRASVAGAGAVLLLVVTVAAAVSKPAPADKAGPTLADSTARQKRDVDPPRPPAGTAPAKVGASKLATVEVLLDRGERERAFALLRELRSAEPADPDYAAMEARLSFEQRRWAEALAAYRMAIRLDDGRRNDGVLINGTIDSLQSEASTRAAEEALRMVGAPAEPYLENAAAEHPSPRVRGRARALLKAGARVATAGGRER